MLTKSVLLGASMGILIAGVDCATPRAPAMKPHLNTGPALQVRILAEYWPTRVFGLTHSWLRNTFVAEVTTGRDTLKKGDLILLQYLHDEAQAEVVAKILNAVTECRVWPERDRSCDQTLSQLHLLGGIDKETGRPLEPVSALSLIPGAEQAKLDKDRPLECYTAYENGLRLVSSQPQAP